MLADGGIIAQTVHGATHFDVFGQPEHPVKLALPERGYVYQETEGLDSAFPSYYQSAFHSPQYLRDHWGQWFEVLAVDEGAAWPNQDVVVLQG